MVAMALLFNKTRKIAIAILYWRIDGVRPFYDPFLNFSGTASPTSCHFYLISFCFCQKTSKFPPLVLVGAKGGHLDLLGIK